VKKLFVFLAAAGGLLAQSQQVSLGVYYSSPVSPVNGAPYALQLDSNGYLKVDVSAGSSGNGAASATGSAVPAQADYQGLNVGGTLRGQTGVNPSGSVYAAQTDITSISGSTVATAASGIMKVGLTDGSGNAINSTSNALNVSVQNASIPVTESGSWYISGAGTTSSSGALATPYHVAASSTSTFNTVKGSAGNFYGFTAYNPNASTCWLMLYDSTAPTVGTTTAKYVWPVLATSQFGLVSSSVALVNHATGITIATTTTDGGASECGTGMDIDVFAN
jgi:hypothetical protein